MKEGMLKIGVILVIIITVASTVFAVVQNDGKERTTDYSDSGNWMYAQTDARYDVDLFYIYPTAVMKTDRSDGCCDITDDMKVSAISAFKESGSAFGDYTNVFAPYYQQVALGSLTELGHYDAVYDFEKNSAAVRDIYASLDYYFEHYNNGRPYILAGHSQGSSIIEIVLETYMADHPAEYKRMIAAYAIGFGVTQEYLDRNPHIKFAESATDTGVLISWNTEGLPKDGAYKESVLIGKDTQVINPLTWGRDTAYADRSLNKGEYRLLDDGTITTVEGVNDARIDAERGSLICTTNTNFVEIAIMGDVSLHLNDYSLYYKDIQINGQDRIAAYFAQ